MDKRLFIAETPCKRLDVFLSEQTDEFTRSRLKKLIEDGKEDKAAELRVKIVERVKIIQQAGAPISADTVAELSELGINL